MVLKFLGFRVRLSVPGDAIMAMLTMFQFYGRCAYLIGVARAGITGFLSVVNVVFCPFFLCFDRCFYVRNAAVSFNDVFIARTVFVVAMLLQKAGS